MRKIVVLLVAIIASVSVLSAQNYMVVDSEKVFTSLTEYNKALSEIEALSTSYQSNVDSRFAKVETMYNSYVAERGNLSTTARAARESEILKAEEEANLYQETIFSAEGELMKRRLELISPIQQRVFAAIEAFAKANGFDLVLDTASNATILYKSSAVDKTDAIIATLK